MADRTLAEVFVAVRPDTSNTGRELERDLSRIDTRRSGDKAGHAYGSAFAGGAKRIIAGIGGIAAAAGIGNVLRESVQGFREHQQVVAQTNAVLKSTKNAANTSVGAVSALSDALERKTKVDGDVIQSGANMLATFTNVQNRAGKGNDIFNRATQTVLDMSVALGTDAPQSAIQLGKALNDPVKGVTALQRVGVTFTKGQRDQIDAMVKAGNVAGAQKVVLNELNKEFGGSAKAQGDALGAQGRLTVAWHQAQDTLGSALLPVVNDFQDALAKRLPGAAEAAADAIPRITAGVKGLYDLLVRGNFTTNFRTAFHLEEDSTTVDRLFRIREGVIGIYNLVVKGNFTSQFRRAFNVEEDSPVVARITKIRQVIIDLAQSVRTLDFGALRDQIQAIDTDRLAGGFRIAGSALGFFADHADLIVKAMPVLIGLFVAYKAAQAAGNVVDLARLPIQAAQVAGNIILARSVKALAVAQREQTAMQVGGNVVGVASVAIQNATAVTTLRARAASLLASAATKAWAATQWLLNAAMTANPIGLVIAAVVALTAGIIFAYKHSETFRRIVDGAFRAVATAARFMWENVLRPVFRFIVDAWFTVAGAIVNGAARAFGWVPGLGPKLKAAAAAFNRFRDSVNNALGGIHDKNVTVTARASVLMGQGLSRSDAISTSLHRAYGGAIKGVGTRTSDSIPILASNDEHMWSAAEVAGAGGHQQVAALRKLAAAGRLPGFAAGGPVQFNVYARAAGMPQFRSDVAAVDRFATDLVTTAATRAAKAGAARLSSTAGGATGRAPGAVGGNAALGKQLAASLYGWTGAQWNALFNLWQGESGWNNNAQNPTSTAYGIAQFLNSTWAGVGASKTSDPGGQIRAGLRYIAQSYGTPANAYGKWLSRSPHWYDQGGWLPPGLSVSMNGTGRPERVRSGRQEDALLGELQALRRAVETMPAARIDGRVLRREVGYGNTRSPGNTW